LAVGSVGGHHGAGDSLANVLEKVGVGVSVTLVGASEVRAAATATGSQPVAESTVDSEFKFAGFGCFGFS
jgi:hypothetical protein